MSNFGLIGGGKLSQSQLDELNAKFNPKILMQNNLNNMAKEGPITYSVLPDGRNSVTNGKTTLTSPLPVKNNTIFYVGGAVLALLIIITVSKKN